MHGQYRGDIVSICEQSISPAHFAKQQEVIEVGLKKFTDPLNSNLDLFPEEVQRILRCVHSHLFERSLTVEIVKAKCGLKNNNVTTKFRLVIGVGIREYVTSQRLKAAASILSNHQLAIYLVATAVGYTEEAFSRLFRETYDCTPSQYREMQSKRKGQEI